MHRSAWRNCLENGRRPIERASSTPGSDRSGPPRPLLAPFGTPIFQTVSEGEFSEVHGSKLPWSGWPLGLWGGAVRPSPTLYLQGSPPMWQGIVASDYDLLRPRLTRISRPDALMKAVRSWRSSWS